MTSAAFDVDQMVVVLLRAFLVACPPVAEIVALEYGSLLEQFDRAIDRGDRDSRVLDQGALVQHFHVGMIIRARQDLGDDPPLLGHAQAFLMAQPLEPAAHGLLDLLVLAHARTIT